MKHSYFNLHKFILNVIYLLLFTGFSLTISAQNQTLDSLKIVLKSHPQKDSTHVKILYALALNGFKAATNDYPSYLNQALALAEEIGNKDLQGRCLNLKAFAYSQKGENKNAIETGLKAKKIYEDLKDNTNIMRVNILLANLYNDMNEEVKAFPFLQVALQKAKEQKNYEMQSQALLLMGAIYITQKQHQKALKSLQEADFLSNITNNSEIKITIYNNQLTALLALNRLKDAQNLIPKYKKLVETDFNIPFYQCQFFESATELSMAQKNYTETLKNANNLYDFATKAESIIYQRNALDKAYKASKALNNSELSLSYLEKFTAINDSIYNETKAKEFANLQTKYETEKKNQEIDFLNKTNKMQVRNMWILIGGMVLLLGLLGLLFFQKKTVSNQKLLIENQNEKLQYLMKELHHRVKNNLQIVSSLLSLQSFQMKDETAAIAIREGQHRIEAMSLIHQKLYTKDDITTVNIKEFITDITESLMDAYGYSRDKFSLKLNIENEFMDVDKAIPISLIVNELVSNSMKYAFGKDNSNPVLEIDLTKINDDFMLKIKDNGKGLDIEKWNRPGDSFGKELIKTFTQQLGAKLQILVNKGTEFNLTFSASNPI
jgi:two-component sensor histidine kinase